MAKLKSTEDLFKGRHFEREIIILILLLTAALLIPFLGGMAFFQSVE